MQIRSGIGFFQNFTRSGRVAFFFEIFRVGSDADPSTFSSGRKFFSTQVGSEVGSKVGRILFKGSLKGSKFDLKKNWLDIARV